MRMLFAKRATTQLRDTPRGVLACGSRTVIRPFERSDVDKWIGWPRHRDPLFDTYNPPVLTARQRDLYFQQRRVSPDGRQFAVDDLDRHFVGRISLREMDWRVRAGVLGVSFNPARL